MGRRRILLTGAAGFIGSRIARRMIAEGHDVFAIIRPASDRSRLAGVEQNLVVIDGDLQNLSELHSQLCAARPDICVHLAWRGWAGATETDQSLGSLSASFELLRAMRDLSCTRFVWAGTCFEYDCRFDRLAETTPLQPHGFNSLYGTCKKALFEVAQQYAQRTGLSVVATRLFNSYGPFEDERRLVPSITRALLRGDVAAVTPGGQVKDYLHVEDVASAIWHVAKSDVTGAVNVASGEPVTIAHVAATIGRLVGRPELVHLGAMPYRPDEPMRILADATLLRQRLGWTPRFDLERGLAETVGWWQGQMKVVA